MQLIDKIQTCANGIRLRVLEHTLLNNGGYLSQACSSAEILSALYLGIMDLGKVAAPIVPGKFCGVPSRKNSEYKRGDFYNGEKSPQKDRFFLSPTHYSLVLYAALIEAGRMSEDGLEDFNKDGGIVEMIGAEHSPGMEVMTGSLGQGISQAAGIAHARKLNGEMGRTWIFMSDGELQPGQVWEAVQAIAFYKLNNVCVIVDVNGHQCDGTTQSVMNIEPLQDRFSAFGWRVKRVPGHDVAALLEATRPIRDDIRPIVLICDTTPWQGIELLKTRAPKFHYVRFRDDVEKKQYQMAMEEMKQRQIL